MECVFDETALEPFLRQIARMANAPAAQLKITNKRRDFVQSTIVGDADRTILAREIQYQARSPRTQALIALPVGGVVRDQDFISDEEIASDETYQDFLIPAGIGRLAGAKFADSPDAVAGIALLRPFSAAPFDDDATRLIAQVADAFTPAFELIQKLRTRDDRRLLNMFDDRTAAAGIDRLGRITETNAQFAELIDDKRITLRPSGAIRLERDQEQRFADALLNAIVARRARQFLIRDESDDARLIATLYPTPPAGAIAPRSVAIVTVEPCETRTRVLDPELLISLFSLTKAEAAVVGMLCDGKSPPEIAVSRGVTIHTVRSMIKSAMRKTETSRQPELVALVSRLASSRGAAAP